MAKFGTFKFGDAQYGTGASGHRFHSHGGGSSKFYGSGFLHSTGGGVFDTTAKSPQIIIGGVFSTGGGIFNIEPDGILAVSGDGVPLTSIGELSSLPAPGGVQAGIWRYTPDSTGTLSVDTHGTGWSTYLQVLAANRTTVLASNEDDPALPASGDPDWTGESALSLSVTAGTTYYVAVSAGTGSSGVGGDGRFLLNADGPHSLDAVPVEFPAPAPPAFPAADSPPAGVVVNPIQRVTITMPSPTLVNGRPVQPWTPAVTQADWGLLQVVFANVDVTWFRGYLAEVEFFELMEPFGCGPARVTLPGITPHDQVGVGDTNFLIGGYTVDILKAGSTVPLWSGFIGNQVGEYRQDGAGYTVECIGELWMADVVSHQPRTYLPPTDIGTLVPVALNQVPHRRVNGITGVTTGIKSAQRGSSDSSVIAYCQELLAASTVDNGSNQWTIARTGAARTYSMRLKDRTTVTWTLQTGQPGIEVRLNLDSSTAVNRIYGRGVRTDGYAWAGWVYPSTGLAAAPSYPYPSPSTTIGIGDTDAGTLSGTGVSDWQRRVNETGIATVKVDGKYDATDAAAAKLVQRAKGLTIDGVVGPQTWAASFDVGANGVDLNAAYRAPLAQLASVTPLLTQADGSFGGANPSDNRSIIVVDRDEDFGDGISKAEAIRSAKAELVRTSTPGWVGEIVLRVSPPEIAMWDIREGTNGVLKGWTGRDVTLHVAQVRTTPPRGTDPGSVTLTVDEHARDLMTLGSILRRDKDAQKNPAMLPPRRMRRSQLRADSVVEYDGESSGGVIPRLALYAGLWTVIRIPVSQAGKVAQVVAQTTPEAPFCLAFFGDAVTPADLVRNVGANPLAERGDGFGPFDWAADKLATLGFIEAIGGPGQAAGYDPGYETSPHTGLSTPLTGKLISTGSWTYRSARPPWLWVAVFCPFSTFISGRIYPAPVDT